MSPGERPVLSVARYLRAEEQVVPFLGRPELDDLLAWCGAGERIGVRLVTGDGGSGKTRLALQLCRELTANGWKPLWVHPGVEAQAAGAVREFGEPCVLVVDYAETRESLGSMLSQVVADRPTPDVRVVLLARGTGEWWQRLIDATDDPVSQLLEETSPITLGPVSSAAEQRAVFDDAVITFADRLGVSRPYVEPTFTDPAAVVLVVHAAALLAVLDHVGGPAGTAPPFTDADVLNGLLRHEARYWIRSAAARSLNLDASVLRLAVAVGCLAGAENESGAAGLLTCIPDLADSAAPRGQVARWLHDLYPVGSALAATAQAEWIGSLRPDRIAEQLVARELTRHPDLIPHVFSRLDEHRIARALTVIARAALHQSDAVGLLRDALTSDLEHTLVPALSVAVETNALLGDLIDDALTTHKVSRGTLEQIAAAIPPSQSLALASPAATVARYLANESSDSSQRAEWLRNLSNRLTELGRREEALAANEESIRIYRDLARHQPDSYLPALALALNNQAACVAELGRREDALTAIEEAVGIYRDLADSQPGTFLPGLARALNNLSNGLADLGQWGKALTAIDEAARIYRELADAEPDQFRPDLAIALNNLSLRLTNMGRRVEALAAIEEAAGIYRELANVRPDAFLPDLAMSMHNRSNALVDLGRVEEALTAIEEATRICRNLAVARPDAFLPDLAGSLNNLCSVLHNLGRREEALTAIEEAINISRSLAEARPDAFLPDLAGSLNNLCSVLHDLGRREEALAAIEEAARIYRELRQAHPDAFLADLAGSLTSLSTCLADLGRQEQASVAAEEATRIYRDLANAHPGAFLPDLARALHTNSARLASLNRREEALAAVEETTRIYQELAEAHPDVFSSDLAGALNSKSNRLVDAERHDQALAPATEATRIYRELAEAHVGTFLPDLARALHNQSSVLAYLGRSDQALTAIEEAVAIRRKLAEAGSDTDVHNLVNSLENLATTLSALDKDADARVALAEAMERRKQF